MAERHDPSRDPETDRPTTHETVHDDTDTNSTAFVLLSGGIDSAVCLQRADRKSVV